MKKFHPSMKKAGIQFVKCYKLFLILWTYNKQLAGTNKQKRPLTQAQPCFCLSTE